MSRLLLLFSNVLAGKLNTSILTTEAQDYLETESGEWLISEDS